jgi:DNA-binding PadR family transcriptional regulator
MDSRGNGLKRLDLGRELLILGLVRRQPLSAYAIDQAVRNHTALYRNLGHGNIYHFVGKLADAGYLGKRSTKAKRGPAKSKVVYHLTARGEDRFHELLNGIIDDTEAGASALEIALVLLGQLSRAQAIRILVRRSKELSAQERRLKRLFGDPESRSGPAQLASFHAVSRLQGETRFVRDILRLVENREWHPEWP